MRERSKHIEHVIEALRRDIALYGITAAELGLATRRARQPPRSERPAGWASRRRGNAPASVLHTATPSGEAL